MEKHLPKPILSECEKKVLLLMWCGLSNKEMATNRNRSVKTIEKHRQSLLGKFGATNTITMLRRAVHFQFLTPFL